MTTETAVVIYPPEELARVETVGLARITTAEDEGRAIDSLAFVQSVYRNLEKARRALVDPLNLKVEEVNARFKPLLGPVKEAEWRVKHALLVWRQEELAQRRVAEEQARREAAARARAAEADRKAEAMMRAAAEKAGLAESAVTEATTVEPLPPSVVPAIPAPPSPALTHKTDLGSATLRTEWSFEVIRPFDVPRAYLSVNETAIRAAVRLGVREIPGVRIFESQQIAGRRA